MAPLVGRYFGKNGKQVDEFGMNLVAAPLPGQGWRTLHRTIQHLVTDMMKMGGIFAVREAANFLSGKVSEPHMKAYTDHLLRCVTVRSSPYAIVPDVHTFNFPTGRQRVRDSGAATSAEAFFEVKTMTACPSRYDHNNKR